MKTKKLFVLAVMLLVVCLAIPAAAGAAAKGNVITPSGYTKDVQYPVVYVMPEDGYADHSSKLASKLQAEMAAGDIMDMVIVETTFTKGSELHADMAALIADIEANYSVIPSASHRAVVGTGVGGHMAYMLTLSDGSSAITAPNLFSAVASIRGDFASSANPYSGSVLNTMKSVSKSVYSNLFVYVDAPVDDEWTNMSGSSNDLGYEILGIGTDAQHQEFTVRPGKFDAAFLNESVARVADRLSDWMQLGMITGEIALDKAVLDPSESSTDATFTITLSNAFASFTTQNTTMKVSANLTDTETGKVIGVADSVNVAVAGPGTYTGTMTIPNKTVDSAAGVELYVTVLGNKSFVTETTLFNTKAPVYDGANQAIDLMGDWYFKYGGIDTGMPSSDILSMTSDKAKAAGWSVVQPGKNWFFGYGDVTMENVSKEWTWDKLGMMSMYAPYMPDLFICGSGYYVKSFYVDEKFTSDSPVITVGRMDDRGQVFLNGTLIGETGMKNGTTTGETTWAAYSSFYVDPSLLKRGAENTIIIRNWNDTSGGGGGWYEADVGLYSEEAYAAKQGAAESARFYEETYYSEAMGQEMEYLIYLPEGYHETDKFYPTVYLLHQFNSDHTSYMTDKIDKHMDELIARTGDEMIVVAPNSDEGGFWRDKRETMVIEDLIPHIEENYRAINDSRYRLTAGCSMGGYGAFAIGLRNPNHFSGVVSFFGAIDMGNPNDQPLAIANATSAEYMDNYGMYFICGNQDSYDFGMPAIRLNQKLEEMDVDHYFFIENGEHNSAFYVPHFQEGIEYVRNQMYAPNLDKSGLVKSLMTGSVDYNAQTGEVTVMVEANEGIKEYFAEIPDSKHTKDTNPDLYVPLVMEITVDGKTYQYIERECFFNDDHMSNSFTYNIFDLVPPVAPMARTTSEDVEAAEYPSSVGILLKASLFNYDSGSHQDIDPLYTQYPVPATGDESNVMLYGMALVLSAAMLVILGMKKVHA
ncbi:MAG: hypothetical protein IJN79_09040 [Clostridia bacterium]|nr:hypothetical protein [Clostridia bacterium]